MTVSAEMPKYQCHKKVWALKVAAIEPTSDGNGALIHPADSGYAPFPVEQAYLDKHRPQAGGYYVVYEDGYASFSPAAAFESGYTKL